MTFSGFDAALLTLAFLVPGFILIAVFERFCPQADADTQVLFVRYLTFSCFNYALWFWLIYLVVRLDFFYRNVIAAAVCWTFIMLISPIALGIFFGFMEQKKLTAKLLEPIAHVYPVQDSTAWDEAFDRTTTNPRWILVTLTDGSEIRGLIGASSTVTSKAKGNDLYIESVCEADSWELVKNSGGVWIEGSIIKTVEFWA